MKSVQRNESRHLGQNEMAGLKGKSGPPGNMNAFKDGLAAIQKRREESIITEHEESVRHQILDGLIADYSYKASLSRPPSETLAGVHCVVDLGASNTLLARFRDHAVFD
jgi:hypothetical protein